MISDIFSSSKNRSRFLINEKAEVFGDVAEGNNLSHLIPSSCQIRKLCRLSFVTFLHSWPGQNQPSNQSHSLLFTFQSLSLRHREGEIIGNIVWGFGIQLSTPFTIYTNYRHILEAFHNAKMGQKSV